MNKVITTANPLEGWTIEEYHEPILANVVVGSNVFSDFASGFETDNFFILVSISEPFNQFKLQDLTKHINY